MIHGDKEFSRRYHDSLKHDFKFYERNKGVAFTIPFLTWTPEHSQNKDRARYTHIEASHSAIMVVVDRGKAGEVMAAASKAGAMGGTIMHGHGAGVPADYYFPLMIEALKDIVLIVSTLDKVDPIRLSITEALELKEVGSGVIYSLPVIESNGLYENSSVERQEAQ